MPLFISPNTSFWGDFAMCLLATATGDVLFMLIIYVTLAVIHRRIGWIAQRNVYSHPATWLIPVVIGVLLAVSFELWAVHAVGRWQYGSMPLIPVIKVGVTPVLQMIVIPLVSLVAARTQARETDAHT